MQVARQRCADTVVKRVAGSHHTDLVSCQTEHRADIERGGPLPFFPGDQRCGQFDVPCPTEHECSFSDCSTSGLAEPG